VYKKALVGPRNHVPEEKGVEIPTEKGSFEGVCAIENQCEMCNNG